MELEIGKTYITKGIKRTITRIVNNRVYYIKDNNEYDTAIHIFEHNYLNKNKPLDKAFKELDKQICTHRNIREDRFFSMMVYKTCKDCGTNLN